MPIAPLNGDRAQVEQDERLIGPVLQLFLKDPRIAIELSGSQSEVDITGMPDDHVRPPHRNPGSAQRGHDLLVHAIGPADIVAAGKQPDMIDDGLAPAAVGAGVAGTSHDVSRRLVPPQSVEHHLELRPLVRIDHIVGVEPEDIIAGGVGKRLVPRRREVVDPGEREHAGLEGAGDLDRLIVRSGIDDHDFIEDPAYRFQALRQVILLVSYDHRQADAELPFAPAGGRWPERPDEGFRGIPSLTRGAWRLHRPHPVVDLLGKSPLGIREKAREIRPGLQRDATAARGVLAPLGGEPPRVLLQKGRGIDAVAGECPAAKVMDEQVFGHGQREPGSSRPFGQIVVIE